MNLIRFIKRVFLFPIIFSIGFVFIPSVFARTQPIQDKPYIKSARVVGACQGDILTITGENFGPSNFEIINEKGKSTSGKLHAKFDIVEEAITFRNDHPTASEDDIIKFLVKKDEPEASMDPGSDKIFGNYNGDTSQLSEKNFSDKFILDLTGAAKQYVSIAVGALYLTKSNTYTSTSVHRSFLTPRSYYKNLPSLFEIWKAPELELAGEQVTNSTP